MALAFDRFRSSWASSCACITHYTIPSSGAAQPRGTGADSEPDGRADVLGYSEISYLDLNLPQRSLQKLQKSVRFTLVFAGMCGESLILGMTLTL
jgi:hypothetical protein